MKKLLITFFVVMLLLGALGKLNILNAAPNCIPQHCPGNESTSCNPSCPAHLYCCDFGGGGGSSSGSSTKIPSPTGLENIGELITKASDLVAPFAVLGFIGSVIYAGYVRMFALGNAEKEQKAMKIAISAAIGFAIIATAPLIVRIAANLLNIDSTYVPV